MERTYANMGITTIRGVWVLLMLLVVVGLNVVGFYAARTHAYVPAGLAGFWIICVAIGNIRTLRELALLDPGERATQVAFQLATVQPILGIIPVVLLLLP
jgi:hypothetical protein